MTEILPCPNPECGADCIVFQWGEFKNTFVVLCRPNCGYEGPKGLGATEDEAKANAIRLHNLIASRVPTDKLKQLEAKWRKEADADSNKEYLWRVNGCRYAHAEELADIIKGDSNG